MRKTFVDGVAARRQLPYARVDGDECAVRLCLLNDQWKAVGGLVRKVGDVDKINGKCIVVQIAGI